MGPRATPDKQTTESSQNNIINPQPPNNDENINEKTNTIRYKRNRAARACEVCHARKARCDAMLHIPCTNCLTFGSECTFAEPRSRKKNKHEPLQTSSNNNENPEANSSAQPAKKKSPLNFISADSYHIDASKLHDPLHALRFFGPSSSVFMLLQDKAQDDSYVNLQSSLPASVIDMFEKKYGVNSVQLELLKSRGAFLIPEKNLCDELIDAYFEKMYTFEPFVDKESFMTKYKDGSISLLLLQSVLLCGACVSKNESLFDDEGSKYLACSTIYRRAKAIYDSGYETDPIVVLQAIVMFLGFWDGFEDVLANSYLWTRIGISIAQGSGFHREIDPASTSLSPTELKLAKLIFWYLYIRDVATAVGYGRPVMIHLDDCDVKLPNINDFADDVPLTNRNAFIEMLKVTEIAAIVMEEQYSVRAQRLKGKGDALAINHCDMLMSSWRASLIPQLQYNPQKEMSFSVLTLNLYYYHTVCQIHRSSITKSTIVNGREYPSEGIFFRALQIIADIESRLIARDELRFCSIYHITVVFYSAVTFMIYKYYGKPDTVQQQQRGYEISMKALTMMGERYHVATIVRDVIAKIDADPAARLRLLQVIRKGNHPAKSSTPEGTTQSQNQNKNQNQNQNQPAPKSVKTDVSISPTTVVPPTKTSHSATSGQIPAQYQDNIHTNHYHNYQNLPPHASQSTGPFPYSQNDLSQHQHQQNVNHSHIPVAKIFPYMHLSSHCISTNDGLNFDPADLFPAMGYAAPFPPPPPPPEPPGPPPPPEQESLQRYQTSYSSQIPAHAPSVYSERLSSFDSQSEMHHHHQAPMDQQWGQAQAYQPPGLVPGPYNGHGNLQMPHSMPHYQDLSNSYGNPQPQDFNANLMTFGQVLNSDVYRATAAASQRTDQRQQQQQEMGQGQHGAVDDSGFNSDTFHRY